MTAITLTVSIATWLTPMPALAEGWLVRYGPDGLGRANAEYRGYSLDGFACAGALMSPADLGKTFWVRYKSGAWHGPCLSVDVAKRTDFYHYVYQLQEIAELTDSTLAALGIVNGARGQVYVGACPPQGERMPQVYAPHLTLDLPPLDRNPLFWPYPVQTYPVACGVNQD